MNTRMVTTGFRMAQWAQVIQDCKTSGENIRNYCQNRGLSKDAYYYWQKKLKEAACEQLALMGHAPDQTGMAGTGFAEVKIREGRPHVPFAGSVPDGHLSIEAPGVRITADAAYPAAHLACLLRELVAPC